MVDRDIELKVLWTSTCNTTKFGCECNIIQTSWTTVSHSTWVLKPSWWKLQCSTKISLNWIAKVWAIKWSVTSLITMGHMPLDYFSNAYGGDVESKRDIEGEIWPWAMCPQISKKRSKPFVKSFGTKQSHKSSYTICETPPKEICNEQTKT
jgi:hypothetical protein